MADPVINVYGQRDPHTEARIVANREGLLALRDLIDTALATVEASAEVFASDGEGYDLVVVERNHDMPLPRYTEYEKW